MSFLSETRRQNKEHRITRDGLLAERLRQRSVKRLQAHLAAFYEHGSSLDINLLTEAFDRMEHEAIANRGNGRISLVEALLKVIEGQPSISCSYEQPRKTKRRTPPTKLPRIRRVAMR
jgi:hypothetical protein